MGKKGVLSSLFQACLKPEFFPHISSPFLSRRKEGLSLTFTDQTDFPTYSTAPTTATTTTLISYFNFLFQFQKEKKKKRNFFEPKAAVLKGTFKRNSVEKFLKMKL